MDKITRQDVDALADILWWIKGYRAADNSGCPFADVHVAALEKHITISGQSLARSSAECRPIGKEEL